jgi:hypothetical protein
MTDFVGKPLNQVHHLDISFAQLKLALTQSTILIAKSFELLAMLVQPLLKPKKSLDVFNDLIHH